MDKNKCPKSINRLEIKSKKKKNLVLHLNGFVSKKMILCLLPKHFCVKQYKHIFMLPNYSIFSNRKYEKICSCF